MPPNEEQPINDESIRRIEAVIREVALKIIIALPASIMVANATNEEELFLAGISYLLFIVLMFRDVITCNQKSKNRGGNYEN